MAEPQHSLGYHIHDPADPAGTYPDVPKEIVLLPLRIFLVVGWLRAGVEKLIRYNWWNGNDLRAFLDKQHDTALAFWRPIMDNLLFSQASAISVVIVLAELVIAVVIAIDTFLNVVNEREPGRGLIRALRTAILFNVIFVFCGVVNPSAFYLVMELVLLSATTPRARGRHKHHSQNRVLWQAVTWFGMMVLFLPFIRTVQPSELIADPASMLSLMAGIYALTLLYRWHKRKSVIPAEEAWPGLEGRLGP